MKSNIIIINEIYKKIFNEIILSNNYNINIIKIIIIINIIIIKIIIGNVPGHDLFLYTIKYIFINFLYFGLSILICFLIFEELLVSIIVLIFKNNKLD